MQEEKEEEEKRGNVVLKMELSPNSTKIVGEKKDHWLLEGKDVRKQSTTGARSLSTSMKKKTWMGLMMGSHRLTR